MKVIKLILLIVGFNTMVFAPVALAQEEKQVGEQRVVHTVRRLLESGELDATHTCLDEYAKRSKVLAWKIGLIPPVGGASAVGGTYAGVYLGAIAGLSTGNIIGVVLFAVLGAYIAAGLGLALLITGEARAIYRFNKTNTVIRLLAGALDGDSKFLKKFVNHFNRKYRRTNTVLSSERAAQILVDGDQKGLFCDGTLTGKKGSTKLRKVLAMEKDLLKYVKSQM